MKHTRVVETARIGDMLAGCHMHLGRPGCVTFLSRVALTASQGQIMALARAFFRTHVLKPLKLFPPRWEADRPVSLEARILEGGVRIHPENARMSGRHGVQNVAQCVACAALTPVVWQYITNLSSGQININLYEDKEETT